MGRRGGMVFKGYNRTSKTAIIIWNIVVQLLEFAHVLSGMCWCHRLLWECNEGILSHKNAHKCGNNFHKISGGSWIACSSYLSPLEGPIRLRVKTLNNKVVFTKSIAWIPLSVAKLKDSLALKLEMIIHDLWEAGGGWVATLATTGSSSCREVACSRRQQAFTGAPVNSSNIMFLLFWQSADMDWGERAWSKTKPTFKLPFQIWVPGECAKCRR